MFDLDLESVSKVIDQHGDWINQVYFERSKTSLVPGKSLLYVAAEEDQPETVRYLLAKGANPNAFYPPPGNLFFSHNRSSFHEAACRNNVAIVQIFLDAGVEVDNLGIAMDDQGVPIAGPAGRSLLSQHTALEWAVMHGAEPVVQLLLQRGAKLRDLTTKRQNNAIHLAMKPVSTSGRDQAKIDRHASDPVRYPNNGTLPSTGYRVMIEALLQAGADLRQPNYAGDQPLHIACEHARCDTIDYLLAIHGTEFDINARNRSGQTPLAIAVQSGLFETRLEPDSTRVIELLVEYGADRSLTCKYQNTQKTAYEIAKSRGLDSRLLELLKPPKPQ